jgi:hypothetical protein
MCLSDVLTKIGRDDLREERLYYPMHLGRRDVDESFLDEPVRDGPILGGVELAHPVD